MTIKEGLHLWMTPGGNAARGWDGKTLTEVVVQKVGRVYFYVVKPETRIQYRFRIDDLSYADPEETNNNYTLWEAPEAWEAHHKAAAQLNTIRQYFHFLERKSIEVLGHARIQQIYDILLDAGAIEEK